MSRETHWVLNVAKAAALIFDYTKGESDNLDFSDRLRIETDLLAESLPVLTVFAGPNGAGKSTMRSILRQSFDFGADIDADAIAKEQGLTNVASGRETIRLVNAHLHARKSFSLETTLSGTLVLQQMNRAKENGFLIRLLFLSLNSPSDHIKRVEQRVAKGGHFIPAEDVIRRYARSHQNLPQAALLADVVTICSNQTDCELVLALMQNQFVQQANRLPDWVVQFIENYKIMYSSL